VGRQCCKIHTTDPIVKASHDRKIITSSFSHSLKIMIQAADSVVAEHNICTQHHDVSKFDNRKNWSHKTTVTRMISDSFFFLSQLSCDCSFLSDQKAGQNSAVDRSVDRHSAICLYQDRSFSKPSTKSVIQTTNSCSFKSVTTPKRKAEKDGRKRPKKLQKREISTA